MTTDREANLGQCFVAIDPSFFASGFTDRMGDLMDHCRNLEPVSFLRAIIYKFSKAADLVGSFIHANYLI